MCGWVWQSVTRAELRRLFDAELPDGFVPKYNLAPTQPLLMVVEQEGRRAVLARWGFLATAEQPKSLSTFNARLETARTSPLFREAFQSRQALIPIDGLYEWIGEKGARRPLAMRRRDSLPLVCAGLWNEQGGVLSCTVLTTAPTGVFAAVHDRMPLLLPQDRWAAWLDPATAVDTVWTLASTPHTLHSAVYTHPVGPAVGNARNEGIELTLPFS